MKQGDEIGSGSRSWGQWKVCSMTSEKWRQWFFGLHSLDLFPYSFSDAKWPATFLASDRSGVIISPCDYFNLGFYNPEGFID